MKFFEVLQKFKKKIIDYACEQEKPEKFLEKKYIVKSFWEFVKNSDVDEDDEYYLRWYEDEYNKNNKLEKDDFIYYTVLGIQEKKDIKEEYLCLYNKELEYNSVLQRKIEELTAQVREIRDDERRKIEKDKKIYFKQELKNIQEERVNLDRRDLIKKAWINCTIPYYEKYNTYNFSRDLYSVQNIDADRSDLIFLGDLPVKQAEEMLMLKKEDINKYSDKLEKMIYKSDILGKIEEKVKENFYIHDRFPIIRDAIMLFKEKSIYLLSI